MNDKLKFYRETLVKMTKEAYKKLPNEMKVEEAVNYGDLLTKAIMKQFDEFADECFGETSNCYDPKFYITVDPRYNVTTTEEHIKTIVDNGPQYQPNQKPYGTLGEHWYELMRLFEVKDFYCDWKKYLSEVIEVIKKNKEARFNSSAKNTEYIVIKGIADKLGIEFIEDFVKACEKCEE